MSTAGILPAVDFHLDSARFPDAPGIFDRLGGRSVLSWSFEVLWKAGCRPIVVPAPQPLVADVAKELGPRGTVIQSTEQRRTTMLDALAMISAERVAVLDFRYPLAAVEDVRATVAGLDEADACIVAVPVKETLKLVSEGVVEKTLDRTKMWHEEMPHAFRVAALRAVHQGAAGAAEPEEAAADDVRAIERFGGRVVLVPGSRRNVRITSREELQVAHALMGSM